MPPGHLVAAGGYGYFQSSECTTRGMSACDGYQPFKYFVDGDAQPLVKVDGVDVGGVCVYPGTCVTATAPISHCYWSRRYTSLELVVKYKSRIFYATSRHRFKPVRRHLSRLTASPSRWCNRPPIPRSMLRQDSHTHGKNKKQKERAAAAGTGNRELMLPGIILSYS